MADDAILAHQRYQIAQAIRDGKWRDIDEITELVGFDAKKALTSEKHKAKNFQRVKRRWKMLPRAIQMLERFDNRTRITGPPIPWRPKTTKPTKTYQYKRRAFGQ